MEDLTKICSNCKTCKPINEFAKGGKSYYCKICYRNYSREYNRKWRLKNKEKDKENGIKYTRTKKGIVSKIYNVQKRNSKKRGHNPPEYTFDQLYKWFLEQPNLEKLWKDWQKSNYHTDFRPSIDRLKNNLSYSFDNIRLTTWKINRSEPKNK